MIDSVTTLHTLQHEQSLHTTTRRGVLHWVAALQTYALQTYGHRLRASSMAGSLCRRLSGGESSVVGSVWAPGMASLSAAAG